MRILVNERLSEHRFKTPEGYLVCTDAILARTGKQTYKRGEVFGQDCKDAETDVEVDRTEKEVFSDATLASFENKPLTVEHPDENVNAENHNRYAVGYVRDVKRAKVDGQDVMTGTLVITDAQTIQEVEDGEHTDLSCGYDCDISDEENPQQRNIRGNHVALCQQGRAGIARIIDSVNDGIVKYYNHADVSRPGDPDEAFMRKQQQHAQRFGVNFKRDPRLGGFWIEGEESKVRAMLSQWYEDDEIDRILRKQMIDSDESREELIAKRSRLEKEWDKADEGNNPHLAIQISRELDEIDKKLKAMKKDSVKDGIKYFSKYFKVDDVNKIDINKLFDDINKSGIFAGQPKGVIQAYPKQNKLYIGNNRSQWAGPTEIVRTLKALISKQAKVLDSIEDDFDQQYAKESRELDADIKKAKQIWKADGGKTARQILKSMGYSSDVEDTFYKTNGSYAKVIVFKGYNEVKYYVLKNGKIPSGWTLTRTTWGDSIRDERNYKIYVKGPFGSYKVCDWPAASKEAAVKEFLESNPDYKNKGTIEARDSINDVNPREGESKDDFISRFMSETKNEYPDEKQRLAVAYSYWDKNKVMKSKGKDSSKWYRVQIPGETNVHLVKATSIEDAINKISRR